VVLPLLDKHKPDITLHIGLAVERDYFAIETESQKEGYHQYPNIRRKVFTKAETKKFWGKRPDRLDSSLDIENIVARWATNAPKGVDVRLSDDVGNYVCGFVYYTSLEHLDKKDRERPVLFLHVPPLDRLEEIRKGRETVLALIRAVVESQR
jgi:pyroglutamyl-peptidase